MDISADGAAMDTGSEGHQFVGRAAAARAVIGRGRPPARRRALGGAAGRRATAGPVLGVLIAGTIAACSGSGGAAGSTGASTPPPATSASAGPGTGTPTGGTAATSPVTAPATPAVPTCPSSSLAAKFQNSDGAAGTVYDEMALTNTGKTRCAVEGYPGVSLLDAAGHQLGAPADRVPPGQSTGLAGESGGRIALAPGGLLVFTVLMTQPGVLPGCLTPDSMAKAFTMRIYPPDNTVALLVAINGAEGTLACADPAVHELRVTTIGAV
jgi:hypothetical protein